MYSRVSSLNNLFSVIDNYINYTFKGNLIAPPLHEGVTVVLVEYGNINSSMLSNIYFVFIAFLKYVF